MSYPPAATVGIVQASELDGYRHLGVSKAVDTIRISAGVLANDPHLTLPVEINALYIVRVRGIYSSGATPGFQLNFSLPAGAALSAGIFHCGLSSATTQFGANTSSTGLLSGIVGTGANAALILEHTLTTSATAGNLVFQWAQNVSNATNTIVRAGTSLHLVRIG